MNSQIMTSWSEYQTAIDQLLAMPLKELRVYDGDLTRPGFEKPARYEALRQIISNQGKEPCLKIAVRDATHIRTLSPRLNNLMRCHNHRMTILETAENLSHLRDSMIIADQCHALILFDQDQARSKLILDNVAETHAYLHRFEEIWQAGGTPLSASTIGL